MHLLGSKCAPVTSPKGKGPISSQLWANCSGVPRENCKTAVVFQEPHSLDSAFFFFFSFFPSRHYMTNHGFYGINMSHFIRDWKLPWQTSDSFSVEEDKE